MWSRARNATMKDRLPNWLLVLAAAICFAEAAKFPKNDPGLVATAVMGLFLLLRGSTTAPQSPVVTVAGWILAALAVTSDEGLLNVNDALWIGVILIAFVAFGFWQRIEKLWK